MKLKANIILNLHDDLVEEDFQRGNEIKPLKKSEYYKILIDSFEKAIRETISNDCSEGIEVANVKVSIMKGR